MNQQSSNQVSSHGSTRATNDGEDTMSDNDYRGGAGEYGVHVPDDAPRFPGDPGPGFDGRYPEEEERDPDGCLILTNKFLRELFKKEPRRYYRTPCLNYTLYLHFKGFNYVKNLEQFINLKCLYFEGNGCRSLKGLE